MRARRRDRDTCPVEDEHVHLGWALRHVDPELDDALDLGQRRREGELPQPSKHLPDRRRPEVGYVDQPRQLAVGEGGDEPDDTLGVLGGEERVGLLRRVVQQVEGGVHARHPVTIVRGQGTFRLPSSGPS